MAFLTLKIPTLVQDIELENTPQYYLRPLFLHYPVASHRRYESAVNQFKKEVKHFFKGFSLSRSNSNHLLWYLFSPEIKYKQFQLDLLINKQFVTGNFSIAYFEMQGLTFVVLPNISNFPEDGDEANDHLVPL